MTEGKVVLSAKNITKNYFIKQGESHKTFCALNNISFDLNAGQILGIIGQNGAGKSTLLKIISEVIPPTEGHIEYQGSILSILEIGSGFHPDLNGIENIFINSALLGMNKNETSMKLNEIIDFSGLGDYIHEPVKTYSSGMYLRLAISIALYTNNDILIIDEVISSGDAEFTFKAFKKLKELVKMGKACILSSHDIQSIVALCDNCIQLNKGEIIFNGKAKNVVENYLTDINSHLFQTENRIVDHDKCRFIELNFQKEKFYINENIEFKVIYEKKVEEEIDIVLNIRDFKNIIMTDCHIYRESYKAVNNPPGYYESTCIVPSHLFNNGQFYVDLIFGDKNSSLLHLQGIGKFTVDLPEWEKTKKWAESKETIPFRPQCNWITKAIS